ncbi:replication-associated recombination protein A [Candidatus Magnetominusculus dajiuhuensis]|uniref:replication-associated recombination protein A n=1 Tax=Candidatus Magnetominusculus dajiuhuensis TaxID=3137712 RepID=UPI003B42C5BF
MDLFKGHRSGVGGEEREAPLAWRLRPADLSEIAGQGHILSKGKALLNIIEDDKIVSLVLYGPPGTGKTATAHIIADKTKSVFVEINAVTSGIKEIREAVSIASTSKTIVFVDEIHRFNKVQQDALLPHIESGRIVLIGASTENPSFALTPALASRTMIFRFNPLSTEDIKAILQRALTDTRGYQGRLSLAEDALSYVALMAAGDARRALNILELAALSVRHVGLSTIDLNVIKDTVSDKTPYYDESEHYDTISAFIKSMRGSDCDAAVYWLAKMLNAGEDPLFIARRIIICASEDVGNADPQALGVAAAAYLSVERVGMPEGRIPLCQAAIYIAQAPKSNACYMAVEAAAAAVRNEQIQPVPLHLRVGAPGYKYPHDYPGHYVEQSYLTNPKVFYEPSSQGYEIEIKNRLQQRRHTANE